MTNTRCTTISRGVQTLAVLAGLLLVTTACSDSDEKPDVRVGPTSTSGGASSNNDATPDSKIASDASEAVVRKYYPTIDGLRQDLSRSAEELEGVTASTQLAAQRKLLEDQRDEGLLQVGDTAIISLEIQSVSLDNSDPATGKVPTAIVDVCWSVDDVDVVDEDGASVVAPDRPAIGWTRFTVANYDWASDPVGGWRVAGGEDVEKAPCDAS